MDGLETTTLFLRTCSHNAENKSIHRLPGPVAGGVLLKSEACGYLFSFTPPLFQSGTSIERLDFNQRLLLIILCGAALAVS